VIRIVRFDRIQPPLTTSLKAAPSDRKTGLGAAATGARYFFQDLHVVDLRLDHARRRRVGVVGLLPPEIVAPPEGRIRPV
jgi:hypothetical protein